MPEQKRSATIIKLGMYLLAVVLINMAGLTLFARFDLTRDRILSLSEASQKVVSTLSEPLTIDVFFSRNLPPPYNTVEQYLHDLLEEYSVYNPKFFNYRFYDVSADEGDISAEAQKNQKLANSYGIYPIQVQAIEKDEVKFQRAYMGLVLIHGDLIEQLSTITTSDGLEYRITTAIQKMNNKISALLRLPDKIQVKLFLSSSLNAVAPFMGLKTLSNLPAQIEQAVKALNAQNYGKLAYESTDPAADSDLNKLSQADNLLLLTWPASADGKVAAGKGVIGLLVEHQGRKIALPLIDVVRLPILGTQYKLIGPEDVSKMLTNSVESLLEIHQGLGILADHRTAPIAEGSSPGNPQDDPQAYSNFREQIALTYTLKPVTLAQNPIPEDIDCLLVVNPREKFTDYELYQIDQFLMQGKNLALFVEAFDEVMASPNQPPVYRPLDTGLERLLEHYGVRVQPAYVLDENCYRQAMPSQMGGGERPIYYAPLIKRKFMNHDLPFMKNIKGLVAVKASPLELVPEERRPKGIKAHLLFASSEKSWVIKDPINLDPMFLRPPASAADLHSRPLAYLLEGEFTSYFAGKPIPVRELTQKKGDQPAAPAAEAPQIDLSKVERQGQFIAQGKPGKIFLLASSDMLKNMVIDETGRGPNTVFVLNAIDYLNRRGDIAVLRAKEQTFNPLSETSAGERTFIKSFIIAGLPLLVVLFGVGVWIRRAARKKSIQAMFASPSA
jgi:ABC-2 type transport system permease protein